MGGDAAAWPDAEAMTVNQPPPEPVSEAAITRMGGAYAADTDTAPASSAVRFAPPPPGVTIAVADPGGKTRATGIDSEDDVVAAAPVTPTSTTQPPVAKAATSRVVQLATQRAARRTSAGPAGRADRTAATAAPGAPAPREVASAEALTARREADAPAAAAAGKTPKATRLTDETGPRRGATRSEKGRSGDPEADGVTVSVAERDDDRVTEGVAETEGVATADAERVALLDGESLCELDGESVLVGERKADAEDDQEALGVAVVLEEPLHEGVHVELAVAEAEGVAPVLPLPVAEAEGVEPGLPLPVAEAEGVASALRVAVSVGDCEKV